MPSRLLQQVLADLFAFAKQPQTAEKRAAINGAIVEITRGLFGDEHPANAAPIDEPPSQRSDRSAVSKYSPFYGLGLFQACPKQLSLAEKPQSSQEIWQALDAEGYKTAHSDPIRAVNDALRRRVKTYGDVLPVGGGKWGRKEWYTEEQLKEIAKSVGGMGGRDKAAHSERTKAGMIVGIERGAKPGQPSKLTNVQWGEVEQLLAQVISPADIADKFGISRQTIYVRYNKHAIKELRLAYEKERAEEGRKDGASETRH
jgi:hypothetical protein